jgi:hypothetical protein
LQKLKTTAFSFHFTHKATPVMEVYSPYCSFPLPI